MIRLHYYKYAVALAAVLGLAACSREAKQNQPVTSRTDKGASSAPASADAEKRDKAMVRVVQAIPGVPAADVFADDRKAFSNVPYKAVTPYQELSDDRHTFRVRPANEEAAQPLAENSEGLSGGKHYTVVALPSKDGRADLMVVNDNITPPAEGKAKVRVIHAAPNAGEVNIYAKGKKDPIFDGVNPKSETRYDEIDPTTGPVEIRPEKGAGPAVSLPNAHFEPGKLYTIIVMGSGKGKLDAVVVEDQLQGMMARR